MSLQARVTNILTKPAEEWPTIAGESTDVATLLRDYAAPLAAIPAVGRWIGMTAIGVSVATGCSDRVQRFKGSTVQGVQQFKGGSGFRTLLNPLNPLNP